MAWKGQACAWGSVTNSDCDDTANTTVAKAGNFTCAPSNYTSPSSSPSSSPRVLKNSANGSGVVMSGMLVVASVVAFLMI